MTTAAYRLPPELLSDCLRAADLPTRVRASHVSRRWRTVALDDARLWNCFSCTQFRDEQHQNAMFDLLQAMLIRSRSLPFRLHIPHRYSGIESEYADRLLDLEQFDVRRLSLYAGPSAIFSQINPRGIPLPAMTSLDIFEDSEDAMILSVLDREFSRGVLPNLEILHANYISFPLETPSFLALRELTCSVGFGFDYQELFDLCRNLVSAQFNDIDVTDRFPSLTPPQSLQSVRLRPQRGGRFNMPLHLRSWAVAQLHRLVIHDAYSIQGVLPLFTVVYPQHRIELRLHSDRAVTMTAIPDNGAAVCAWTISPSPSRQYFIDSLDTAGCPRLTSLSVSAVQISSLFLAQLHAPGLERLELRLNGYQDLPPLRAESEQFFIRAPRLQHLRITADTVRASIDEIHRVLSVLRSSFRTFIVYDADLLESITLSESAETVRKMKMGCADFAPFAKVYTVCGVTA